MNARKTLLTAAATAAVALGSLGAAAAAQAAPLALASEATTLRLDGIGPLKLGMRTSAALRTGWLADRTFGCKLGGPPYPISYSLSGDDAPAGVVGSAEFNGGKLTNLSFRKGVRTAVGVTLGQTTARGMANRYKDGGFNVRVAFADIFGGTFVAVNSNNGKQVLGGFARGRATARKPVSILAIPFVATCE